MRNRNEDITKILARIPTGTPLTVTNKARLKIWIEELIEEINNDK